MDWNEQKWTKWTPMKVNVPLDFFYIWRRCRGAQILEHLNRQEPGVIKFTKWFAQMVYSLPWTKTLESHLLYVQVINEIIFSLLNFEGIKNKYLNNSDLWICSYPETQFIEDVAELNQGNILPCCEYVGSRTDGGLFHGLRESIEHLRSS